MVDKNYEGLCEAFLGSAKKQLRFLEKTKVNLVELPPVFTFKLFSYDVSHKGLVVEEYADYIELGGHQDALKAAESLGFAAGSLFNSLASNAMRKYGWGVHILDPLVNNLKFHCVLNSEPSVADPAGIIPGWTAFRLKFAAGA